MTQPLPPHPNVRKCTHIKVTGQQCGSPALRREFFCYFHTRVIKGVQQRVDMQLHSMALLEDCESIQLSIMHVVDGLIKGTLDATRARLIIQALRIAARNVKNVRFDDVHYLSHEQPMVREVPDYARQYLIEHPEFGPPLSQCGATPSPCSADTPVREAEASPSPCSAGALAREAATKAAVHHETKAEPQAAPQKSVTTEPAAEPRQNAAHGASRATKPENDPAPEERKNPRDTTAAPDRETLSNSHYESQKNELERVQAAIPGAERGNWRDLRTVFEFAGITEKSKEAPS